MMPKVRSAIIAGATALTLVGAFAQGNPIRLAFIASKTGPLP